MQLLWVLISFISGSLPLSLWIGFLAGVDIRQTGDGNPGATNVFRSAGTAWGVAALVADILKAVLPIGIAFHIFGWHDPMLIPITLAPSVGHAFSPFLGFNGGKALATIGGSWIALTWHEMTIVLGLSLILFNFIIKPDGWVALATTTIGLLYLLLFLPDPIFIPIMGLQILLVVWTHRADLQQRPVLGRQKSA